MKRPLLAFKLLLSMMMYSSTVFAEWTKVSENISGDTFYIDFTTVKYRNGMVYYWELSDYVKPSENGTLSVLQYNQGHCDLVAEKGLSWIFYGGPMGKGPILFRDNDPDKNWKHRPAGTSAYDIIKRVCENR